LQLAQVEILKAAGGSIKRATELYTEMVQKDRDLMLELLEPVSRSNATSRRLARPAPRPARVPRAERG
jgi:hypothetical protein